MTVIWILSCFILFQNLEFFPYVYFHYSTYASFELFYLLSLPKFGQASIIFCTSLAGLNVVDMPCLLYSDF